MPSVADVYYPYPSRRNEWAEFEAALSLDLVRALRYLNARTPHRFTGVFSFREDLLINTCLVDSEVPLAPCWAPFPSRESYCSLVQTTGAPVVIGNALLDLQAQNHPARERIISYCGVPLRDSGGELVGSLCHFDYRPILFSRIDLPFLIRAAARLGAITAAG